MYKTLVLLLSLNFSLLADPKKPNILFAFADDWGRHASVYAETDGPGTVNDVFKTTNFDLIAKSGVLFNNAYVNAPSCTPCRSSILSGQHFWRTGRGAILQGAVWDESIPTWPLLLEKNGYHIGYTWKVWSPGSPKDAPFGGSKNAYSSAGVSFNGFSQTATKLISKGMNVEEAKEELLKQVRENFISMLSKRKEGQPFAYWFGPTNVHRKWIKGSGMNLWGISADSLKGKLPPFLPDVHTVREDFSDYLGEVKGFDLALGVLIEELKKGGLYDSTIIAISGDHGPAGFPYGKCNLYDFGTRVSLALSGPGIIGNRVVNDFVTLPDLASTFLESGNVEVPNVMTSKSLWPILKSNKKGIVDESRDHVLTGRERHVARARRGQMPYPQRAIRTDKYLYIMNFKPDRYPLGDHYNLDTDKEANVNQLTNNTFITIPDEDAGPTKAWIVKNRKDPKYKKYFSRAYGKRPLEELYDLKKDPYQMNNVARESGYARVRIELNKKLFSLLTETNDPRLLNDGSFFENPPMSGPVGGVKIKK